MSLDTISATIGVGLYVLVNWSYTTAVFTSPGTPESGYSQVPTDANDSYSFTVKSTGERRFCKKCHATKPDRTHHCSTCQKCVLKMDHHCPWLATCVGFKNYKAFLLFLIYTSVFCWLAFGMTACWLWSELFKQIQYDESFTPINYVLLCVISGIIGFVLTGFTAWHIYLACNGQTTIERLEKTRYLTPLRNTVNRKLHETGGGLGRQLTEVHANMVPGVTRREEGDDSARDLERGNTSYLEHERSREYQRYEDYLEEQESDKLPHAFDLGWRQNLQNLMGPEPSLRWLPICNTTGDGINWEPSERWKQARDSLQREREQRQANTRDNITYPEQRHYLDSAEQSAPSGLGDVDELHVTNRGRSSSQVSMKTLYRRNSFSDQSSNGDDEG